MTSEVSAVSVGISFTPSLARPVRRFKSQRQHPPHHPCGSKHTLTHTHMHKQKLPETEAEREKDKKQRWWPSCFMAVAQSQEQSRDLLIFQKVSCLSSLFFFFSQRLSLFFSYCYTLICHIVVEMKCNTSRGCDFLVLWETQCHLYSWQVEFLAQSLCAVHRSLWWREVRESREADSHCSVFICSGFMCIYKLWTRTGEELLTRAFNCFFVSHQFKR